MLLPSSTGYYPIPVTRLREIAKVKEITVKIAITILHSWPILRHLQSLLPQIILKLVLFKFFLSYLFCIDVRTFDNACTCSNMFAHVRTTQNLRKIAKQEFNVNKHGHFGSSSVGSLWQVVGVCSLTKEYLDLYLLAFMNLWKYLTYEHGVIASFGECSIWNDQVFALSSYFSHLSFVHWLK